MIVSVNSLTAESYIKLQLVLCVFVCVCVCVCVYTYILQGSWI